MNEKGTLGKMIEDLTDDKEFLVESAKIAVTEEICRLMEQKNMNRTDLAKKLNCSNAYITKLLDGSQNLTLEKLVEIGQAIGCKLDIAYVPHGQEIGRFYRYEVKPVNKDVNKQPFNVQSASYESNCSNAA